MHPAVARTMPPAPSAAVGLTRQGLARFAVGDLRAAEQAFRTVVQVAPHETLSWNNLALVLVALGELEQAVPVLRRSLGLDSTQVLPWVSLAGALLRLGRAQEAQAASAAALALDPASPDVQQIQALACVEAEDFAAAAEAFAHAIALGGESATLSLNLAAALLRCGRFDEAGQAADQALALDPSAAAALEISRLCKFILGAVAGDLTRARAVYPPHLYTSPTATDRIFRTALLYLDWAGQGPAAAPGRRRLGGLAPRQPRGDPHARRGPVARRDAPARALCLPSFR